MKALLLAGILAIFISVTPSLAQQLPNTNQPAPGTLLAHVAPEMGRLAIIEIIGDYVITIPEMPSSPPDSDFIVRAWDISDPTNPREAYRFGTTTHPFLAHGLIKRNNEVFIGPFSGSSSVLNAIRANSNGTLSHVRWSGPNIHWGKGGLMHPWAARNWWSYGDVNGDMWLQLRGEQTATWDHLGQTGVIGFPAFMGNLMLVAADQSKTGMASYDVSNPTDPRLLDVVRRPMTHPTIRTWDNQPAEYGIGGYWNEISHHYMVFARRGSNPGVQVVDFSDPNNLRLHCEFLAKQGLAHNQSNHPWYHVGPMYVGFQDEYIFSERFKININNCDVVLDFDSVSAGVETSQYSRPIGNLVLTGGLQSWQIPTNSAGMGIWVHQSSRDTRAPYVAYHIPRPNQVNYPRVAPISIMIPETLRSETIRVGDTLRVLEVGGSDIPFDYILSHTGMLTIDAGVLNTNTTYEVRLQGIQDAVRNSMRLYSFRFSTGPTLAGSSSSSSRSSSSSSFRSSSSSSFRSSSSAISSAPATSSSSSSSSVANNQLPRVDAISVSPSGGVPVNEEAFIDVLASDPDGDGLEFRFRVQGLSNYTPWSASNAFRYTFAQEGNYTVNVQVRDSRGGQTAGVTSINVIANRVNTAAGINSGPMALSPSGEDLWVVNPDNDSVAHLNTQTLVKIGEYPTGTNPRSVAIADDGHIWITNHKADTIEIFNNQGQRQHSIQLAYGSAPAGIVIDRQNQRAFVALYGKGQVVRFDTSTRAETGRIPLGYSATALALSADGERLLVTRFISGEDFGEVWDLSTQPLGLTRSFRLYPSLTEDTLANGRGLPNYLSSVIINSAGTRAYVVGKKDNLARGLLNGNDDLDDDNSVRTLGAVLDLSGGTELRSQRIDFDNTDSPAALALTPNENYLLVAMQGRNQVFAVNLNTNNQALGGIAAQFSSGLAPQGLLLDREHQRLYVKNFMGRSVTALELGDFLSSGSINPMQKQITTVANEKLTPEELRGKQLFYNAAEGISGDEFTGHMSAEGYISCASCHFDGGHDGRTWDFTGRGEGVRNNISLRGRSGTRFGHAHWSANFDEIQDFESDIRNVFLGRGLMSDNDFTTSEHPLGPSKAGLSADLDALAAYVATLGKTSLPRSPHRANDGSLTPLAMAGEAIFDSLDCGSCHTGKAFTDGLLHDVGTLRSYSGQRLGNTLPGIKTPSLLSLFDSAPYLHDGSAETLEQVFAVAGGQVYQAEDLQRSGASERIDAQGFSYYRQGAAVSLSAGGSLSVTHSISNAGAGGLRARISSSSGGNLRITVNGVTQILALPSLPQIEGETVAFREVSLPVNWIAGNNTVELSRPVGAPIFVDDITISSPIEWQKAQVHTRVSQLSVAEKERLFAYLLQVDQANAPEDNEWISVASNPLNAQQNSSSSQAQSSAGANSSVPTNNNGGGNNTSQDQNAGGGYGGVWLIGLLLMLVLSNRCLVRSQAPLRLFIFLLSQSGWRGIFRCHRRF